MQIKGKGFINFSNEFNKAGENWISFSFTDSYKNKEGEYEKAYVNMVAFGDNADKVKEILKSGKTMVELEGFTSGAYKNKLEFCVTDINHFYVNSEGKEKSKKKTKSVDNKYLPF